jgi:hypothetical protein
MATSGNIVKISSSKSRVKSKPPRQCLAHGPKAESTLEHDNGVGAAIISVLGSNITAIRKEIPTQRGGHGVVKSFDGEMKVWTAVGV